MHSQNMTIFQELEAVINRNKAQRISFSSRYQSNSLNYNFSTLLFTCNHKRETSTTCEHTTISETIWHYKEQDHLGHTE